MTIPPIPVPARPGVFHFAAPWTPSIFHQRARQVNIQHGIENSLGFTGKLRQECLDVLQQLARIYARSFQYL